MPLRWFICPDNERIEVAACLKEGGCRMGNRCASRSYLMLASSERPLHWVCSECKTEIKEDRKCQK
jgi:hypothetical protein